MRSGIASAIVVGIGILAFAIVTGAPGTAHAYPLGSTSPPLIPPGVGAGIPGLQGFNLGTTVGTAVSQDVSSEAHGAAEQLDAWLYTIIGFHILDFFNSILTIFSWILGWLKGGVDWLRQWI